MGTPFHTPNTSRRKGALRNQGHEYPPLPPPPPDAWLQTPAPSTRANVSLAAQEGQMVQLVPFLSSHRGAHPPCAHSVRGPRSPESLSVPPSSLQGVSCAGQDLQGLRSGEGVPVQTHALVFRSHPSRETTDTEKLTALLVLLVHTYVRFGPTSNL